VRALRETRGTAIVELAIVLPVLVLLLVGILEFGRAYNAYATVRSASAEGAHWAALHPSASPADIAEAVRARVIPLDASAVDVAASYREGSSFVDWPDAGIPATTPARFVPVRVVVSYPWSAATFFIAKFFPDRSGATLTATTTAEALR
jgi:Flp pilus assembly protein TadG